MTCNPPTYRFRDIRGQMANIDTWKAKNGPPEPPFLTHIWWPLKILLPKGEKACLDDSDTIMQNSMPIGVTVAEISVPGQRNTETHQI